MKNIMVSNDMFSTSVQFFHTSFTYIFLMAIFSSPVVGVRNAKMNTSPPYCKNSSSNRQMPMKEHQQ